MTDGLSPFDFKFRGLHDTSLCTHLDEAAWRSAFLIRSFEERLLKLFSEGKLCGTVHTCIGEEFTGIAVAKHLRVGDYVITNHRCHGHYLARTGDANGLMAEIMGRTTGLCGGRGGSQHICASRVMSNGIQGGMMPVAAGLALAQKLQATHDIVVVFIGDGTLGEGVVYETLNIASKWKLPLLFILEDNGYAQSTPRSQVMAGTITKRVEAFDIASYHGDTWGPADLIDLMGLAMRQVREHSSPVFVHIDTYRLMAHSKGDDIRAHDEVECHRAIDPLTRFSLEHAEIAASLRFDADKIVSQAVDAALTADSCAVPSATTCAPDSPTWKLTKISGKERVGSRIHQALRDQFARNDDAIILGEDIEAPYCGAFKVTKDLSTCYPSRVRNTPISEAAIVGIGNGLALAGMQPICEIMFGDFLTLAADQFVNHAAKFCWMYNGQVQVPMIIRVPMGGRRGYGPTHSQCLEKHFVGLPDTQVLALHHRFDPNLIYRQLFATIDRPTIVIENKSLYGEYVTHETIRGFWCEHTDETFPTTRIRSCTRPDITIVCYGGSLPDAEKAVDRLFEMHELVAEIICPTRIYPLYVAPILEAARASGRLLVVEEGQQFCGFGAEVIATVHEDSASATLVSRRLGAAAHPIPSCKSAELDSLPSVDSIVHACLRMVGRV